MSKGAVQWLQHKKHQVGPEWLWQVLSDNHDPPMMEYFELSTGESEGITPWHCPSTLQGTATSSSGHSGGCWWRPRQWRTHKACHLCYWRYHLCCLSLAHLLPHLTIYNLSLWTNSNQSKNGCTHQMNLNRRKPASGRCMSWGWYRRRPSLRMTRPWRRLASRSTRWKNRQVSHVNAWVGKSDSRMSSGDSAICLKHLQWRKRQSFEQKLPKGDSSKALPTTYSWWAKLMARPQLLSSYSYLGATMSVPIPVYKPPTPVQSMKTSQNSGSEPTAILETVKSGDSGSAGKQLYIYMHSGDTKDSGFGAFAEALMPATSQSIQW